VTASPMPQAAASRAERRTVVPPDRIRTIMICSSAGASVTVSGPHAMHPSAGRIWMSPNSGVRLCSVGGRRIRARTRATNSSMEKGLVR